MCKGNYIFSALDLEWFIFKLESIWKCSKSLSRFGRETWGLLRKSKRSLAKAATLYVRSFMVMPLMSWFRCILFSRGSKVRAKTNGEKGHPCQVQLWRWKAFDRWPLTCTLAT